jgi:hypothetical protein
LCGQKRSFWTSLWHLKNDGSSTYNLPIVVALNKWAQATNEKKIHCNNGWQWVTSHSNLFPPTHLKTTLQTKIPTNPNICEHFSSWISFSGDRELNQVVIPEGPEGPSVERRLY